MHTLNSILDKIDSKNYNQLYQSLGALSIVASAHTSDTDTLKSFYNLAIDYFNPLYSLNENITRKASPNTHLTLVQRYVIARRVTPFLKKKFAYYKNELENFIKMDKYFNGKVDKTAFIEGFGRVGIRGSRKYIFHPVTGKITNSYIKTIATAKDAANFLLNNIAVNKISPQKLVELAKNHDFKPTKDLVNDIEKIIPENLKNAFYKEWSRDNEDLKSNLNLLAESIINFAKSHQYDINLTEEDNEVIRLLTSPVLDDENVKDQLIPFAKALKTNEPVPQEVISILQKELPLGEDDVKVTDSAARELLYLLKFKNTSENGDKEKATEPIDLKQKAEEEKAQEALDMLLNKSDAEKKDVLNAVYEKGIKENEKAGKELIDTNTIKALVESVDEERTDFEDLVKGFIILLRGLGEKGLKTFYNTFLNALEGKGAKEDKKLNMEQPEAKESETKEMVQEETQEDNTLPNVDTYNGYLFDMEAKDEEEEKEDEKDLAENSSTASINTNLSKKADIDSTEYYNDGTLSINLEGFSPMYESDWVTDYTLEGFVKVNDSKVKMFSRVITYDANSDTYKLLDTETLNDYDNSFKNILDIFNEKSYNIYMELFGGNGPKNSSAFIDDTASQKINLSKTSKVVKEDGKYTAKSEKGKNFGTYDTKEEAEKRVQQMEMFKHMKNKKSALDNFITVDASEACNIKVIANGEVIKTCKSIEAAYKDVLSKIASPKEPFGKDEEIVFEDINRYQIVLHCIPTIPENSGEGVAVYSIVSEMGKDKRGGIVGQCRVVTNEDGYALQELKRFPEELEPAGLTEDDLMYAWSLIQKDYESRVADTNKHASVDANVSKKADQELKQFDMKQELDGQKEFEQTTEQFKDVSVPEEEEDTSEVSEALDAEAPKKNPKDSFSATELGNNLAFIQQNKPEDFKVIMENLKKLLVGDEKKILEFLENWSTLNFQDFTKATRMDQNYERHSQYQDQLKKKVLPLLKDMNEYKSAIEEKVSAEKGNVEASKKENIEKKAYGEPELNPCYNCGEKPEIYGPVEFNEGFFLRCKCGNETETFKYVYDAEDAWNNKFPNKTEKGESTKYGYDSSDPEDAAVYNHNGEDEGEED